MYDKVTLSGIGKPGFEGLRMKTKRHFTLTVHRLGL